MGRPPVYISNSLRRTSRCDENADIHFPNLVTFDPARFSQIRFSSRQVDVNSQWKAGTRNRDYD